MSSASHTSDGRTPAGSSAPSRRTRRRAQTATALNARLNAQAFPTDWRIIPDLHTPGMSWIPSISALNDSTVAIKEHLALTFDTRGNTLKP